MEFLRVKTFWSLLNALKQIWIAKNISPIGSGKMVIAVANVAIQSIRLEKIFQEPVIFAAILKVQVPVRFFIGLNLVCERLFSFVLR